jgi:hypothetical protein
MSNSSEIAFRRLLIRNCLLQTLALLAPAGVPLQTLRNALRINGHVLDSKTTQIEIEYLASKEFCEQTEATLSAGLLCWKLAAKGREYLEREELI